MFLPLPTRLPWRLQCQSLHTSFCLFREIPHSTYHLLRSISVWPTCIESWRSYRHLHFHYKVPLNQVTFLFARSAAAVEEKSDLGKPSNTWWAWSYVMANWPLPEALETLPECWSRRWMDCVWKVLGAAIGGSSIIGVGRGRDREDEMLWSGRIHDNIMNLNPTALKKCFVVDHLSK